MSKDNRFNITGEFTIEIKDEKQNYKLIAIHPNRTIAWSSVYSSLDTKTCQSSKIELAKNIWFGYNVEVLNHTVNELESQELRMKISYPARDVSVGGLYVLKDDSFDTDVSVQWLKKEVPSKSDDNEEENNEESSPGESKTIEGKIQWRDLEANTKTKDHQSMLFGLKHPSFEKDVTLQSSYYRDEMNVTRLQIDYDYSEDEYHHATFKSEIKNWSEELGFKNYTISVSGTHEASELKLEFDGSIGLKPNNYKMEATGIYKRGYLPEMELNSLCFIDIDSKEIKIYVSCSLEFLFNFCLHETFFSVQHQTKLLTSTEQHRQTSQSTLLMESTLIVLNMSQLGRSS